MGVQPGGPVLNRDLPLFQSAHAALRFAYSYSANQHAVAAAAERAIAMHGKERYRELQVRAPSRGLVGVDGAAQAGLIRAQVERLPRRLRRAIEARFAFDDDELRARALAELALHARGALKGPIVGREHESDRPLMVRTLAELVRKHYGAQVQLATLAQSVGQAERTMFRRYAEVRRALAETERVAMARVEVELEGVGVCEAMAT